MCKKKDSTLKKKNSWIAVVTGVICKQDQVLLGLRPPKGSLPGFWEFPGGKIELGELPEEALKRELKEELDIEADVGSLCFATTHTYDEVGILLLFYHIKFWKGQPKTVHHSELKWTRFQDLDKIQLPDANKKAIKFIRKAVCEL
jgi:8-oxo-dGTP diphosphatase